MKTISRREEQIIIAIWNLKESAYLLAIKNHLSQIMQTDWSVGTIHKPLMKLEKEGLVESYMGEDFLDNLVMEAKDMVKSAIRGCASFGLPSFFNKLFTNSSQLSDNYYSAKPQIVE